MISKEIYGNALEYSYKFHPLIKRDYKLFFTIDLPINVRIEYNMNKNFNIENLKINIYKKNLAQQEFLIEIYSNKDLFFVYRENFDSNKYQKFKTLEEVTTKFQNFPNVLKEILEEIKMMNDVYKIEILIKSENNCYLIIKQNLKCKEIILFKILLNKIDDLETKDIVNFRLSLNETKNEFIKNKIQNIYSFIKDKNPNILLNFN